MFFKCYDFNMKYYVYILKCADNTLYTGIAIDIEKRLLEHNGKEKGGAKYTRARRPVELVYKKAFKNRSESMKEESRIKKLTRGKKLLLINGK